MHLTEDDPRAAVKAATEGRGVDAAVDAVGHPDALELACRVTRKAGTVSAIGVYAERIEVHMGIVWIKALTLKTGHANVIGHVDRVLAMLDAGRARPAAARHPPHEAGGRARGLRGLRPPRGAQDRDDAVSVERGHRGDARRAGARSWRQGAEPIGWKVGFNVPEIQQKLGIDAPLAGFLTTDSLLEDGAGTSYRRWSSRARWPSSSATTAARSSRSSPRSSSRTRPTSTWTIEQILAGNIFHRAVAFGPRVETARPRRRRASS